ncbi:MAG: carboxylesterase family protein [Planctomycetota bacterium]|jgi:pimeloyl-ACP methyl ester carboxylesterase
MRRLLAILLAICCLAAAGMAFGDRPKVPKKLDSRVKEEIDDLLTAYFRAGTESARAEALEGLRARDPVPPKALKDFTKLCLTLAREGPKSKGGGARELQSGPVKGTYLVTSAGRGRKGLFIGLHGGGPDAGDARGAQSKWSPAGGKGCICVFPQATRLVHDAWNQVDQEQFVLAIIEEMKRTYPIDTNRVYVAGHSMGGFGSWSLGGRHADLFAAISPNSGGPYGEKTFRGTGDLEGRATIRLRGGVIRNLYLLPTRWFHGTADRQCPIENGLEAERQLEQLKKLHPEGYEYVFHKEEGLGHGIMRGGLGPIIEWMCKRKRNPYPRKVIWEPYRRYKKHFYWLAVPRVPQGAQIIAEIEKRRRIVITTSGYVPHLSLLLSDELVDAARELEVVWNEKEVYRGYVTPSVATLAESIHVRRDPAMVSTYRIDLKK